MGLILVLMYHDTLRVFFLLQVASVKKIKINKRKLRSEWPLPLLFVLELYIQN